MTDKLFRAQILLEPEQHRSLAELARLQGRSLSELMREIVDQYLTGMDEAYRKQLDAFERIKEHRSKIIARRGGKTIQIDLAAVIQEMREERDDQLFRSLSDDRH